MMRPNQKVNLGVCIISKHLCFCPFTKALPWSFQTEMGKPAFPKVSIFGLEKSGVVWTAGINIAKVMRFKAKTY